MKKRTIFSITITIIALSTILVGCKNKAIYVDPAGNTMIAVTDEKKNTVLNSDGNILVYQTDESGNIETDESGVPHTISSLFPDRIVTGKYVQTPTYTLTLPSGWEATPRVHEEYFNKSANAKLTVEVLDEPSLDEYKEKFLGLFELLRKAQEEEGGVVTLKEDSFEYIAANTKAIRLFYELTKEGIEPYKTTVLIFMNNDNLYKISFSAEGDNFEKAKFSEFYNAINYKPYKYY